MISIRPHGVRVLSRFNSSSCVFTGKRNCPDRPFTVGEFRDKAAAGPRSTCTTCDLHQRAIKCQTKKAKDAGLLTCLKPPLCPGIAATLMQDVFCEWAHIFCMHFQLVAVSRNYDLGNRDNETLRKLNKAQMGPFPRSVTDGVLEGKRL